MTTKIVKEMLNAHNNAASKQNKQTILFSSLFHSFDFTLIPNKHSSAIATILDQIQEYFLNESEIVFCSGGDLFAETFALNAIQNASA